MGTVPTIATFSPGVLTAAYLNTIKAATDFVQSPPSCMAYHSTLVSLATSGTYQVIPMQSELFDNVQAGDPGCHDNVTNNSRLVARTAGKYEITGQLSVASNATGVRAADIRMNAAGVAGAGTEIVNPVVPAISGFNTVVAVPLVVVQMAIGDYIEMFGMQSSGGALNTGTGAGSTFLRFKWVGI